MNAAPASAGDITRTINTRFLMLAAANMAGAAGGFLLLSLIGHANGAAALGQISVAVTVLTYAQIVTNFGSDSFAIRSLVGGRSSARDLISTVMASRLLLCVPTLLVVGGLCLTVPAFQDERALIGLLMVSVVASAVYPLWAAQAFEQTGVVALCNTAGPLLNLILGGAAVLLDLGLGGFAAARVAADLVVMGSLLLWTLRRQGWGGWPALPDVWRFIRGAAPIGGSKLLAGVSMAADLIIVDLVIDTATTVGHFAAPARIYALIFTLSGMYFVIVLPMLARAAARGARWLISEMLWSLLRTVPAAMLGAGLLALLAQPLLRLGFGNEFGDATPILQLLMLAAVANLISRTFGQALIAGGRAPSEMRATLVGVSIGLIAKVWATTQYGVLGMAFAIVGAELLLVLLQGRAVVVMGLKRAVAGQPGSDRAAAAAPLSSTDPTGT